MKEYAGPEKVTNNLYSGVPYYLICTRRYKQENGSNDEEPCMYPESPMHFNSLHFPGGTVVLNPKQP